MSIRLLSFARKRLKFFRRFCILVERRTRHQDNLHRSFHFSIPQKTWVSPKVFDVMGREIAVLVSDELEAGSYSATWQSQNLPSGVYFHRMNSDGMVLTKKMKLVR
jgi:hypothetical protein